MRPYVYALAFTLAIVAGVAMGYFEDGGRVGPSPVLLYEDAAALVEPSPMAYGVKGRATWYGAPCREGTYLGRREACTPYVAKSKGGRGGELWRYCAVGWWTWKAKPVLAEVYFHATKKTTTCVVRDYCQACAESRAVIDLAPLVFLESGLTLGHGVATVSVRCLGAR